MPVKEAADLSSLLRSIQSAKTPIERFKLAARSWRTVRALPRDVRLRLARQIGVEGVEEVLERLADGKLDGRASSKELLRILEEAEKADPARAKALLASAKDVGRQKEMLRRAAEAIRQQVFETSAPSAPVAVPRPEPPAAALPLTPQVQPPPVETPPPPPVPGKPAPAYPIPVPAAPAERPSIPITPTVGAPTAFPPQVVVPGVAPFASSAPAPPPALPPETLGFLDRLREASTVRRLRLLREGIEGIRPMSPDELRAVLEAFPVGWTRRRALAALLRAGVPAETSEATALIEELDSSSARLWCYAALLERPDLSDAERGAIRTRTPIGGRSARQPAASDGTDS
ncbi:MAG: hypothetical protein H7X85_10940 [Thermoanaerobaculia bacterium]|nr:hypothetical protein [Thermoanaerobaculia bacterium]